MFFRTVWNKELSPLKSSSIASEVDFIHSVAFSTMPRFPKTIKELLYQEKMENSVRLLGISLANLNTEDKKSEPKENKISVQLRFGF